MIPFAHDTVTLYRKTEAGWTPAVISGCSYRRIRRRSIMDGTARITEETTCRIPAGNPKPEAGSVIVLGVCTETADSDIALVRLLESRQPHGAFRVQSVADNARAGYPVPHYAATGA